MADNPCDPCPFCGGTEIDPRGCWGSTDDDDRDTIAARCVSCGAQGPEVALGRRPSPADFDAAGDASAAAWNRRTPPAP